MQLKSFGCSFIFGTDLVGADSELAKASKLTWPALLAQDLDYEYSCYARPGSGNLQILEQVLNQNTKDPADLAVVGWTWIDRFDYYNSNCKGRLWEDWSTIMPVDETELAQIYYRELHSEYRDKFTNLGYIRLAIDTLNQKGIPFIMTYVDELLFDQRWHTSPAVIELQEYIKPHMTTFNRLTFLEWSRQQGYPESVGWHPLEDAHQAAFELIKCHSFS